MSAHVVDVQTQMGGTLQYPSGLFRYRWRCACGKVGYWRYGSAESGAHGAAARMARNGGARYVAAMERGK